jgi:hypothetical protein
VRFVEPTIGNRRPDREISTLLIQEDDLNALYNRILDVAIGLMSSQMLGPERNELLVTRMEGVSSAIGGFLGQRSFQFPCRAAAAAIVCGAIALSRAPTVSRITAWARLTITSNDGVSANIAKARLTISCRVGNGDKCRLALRPLRDSAPWRAFPGWRKGQVQQAPPLSH